MSDLNTLESVVTAPVLYFSTIAWKLSSIPCLRCCCELFENDFITTSCQQIKQVICFHFNFIGYRSF